MDHDYEQEYLKQIAKESNDEHTHVSLVNSQSYDGGRERRGVGTSVDNSGSTKFSKLCDQYVKTAINQMKSHRKLKQSYVIVGPGNFIND